MATSDEEALTALIRLAESDHSALRTAAVWGMSRLVPDTACAMRAALVKLESDEDADVRSDAQVVKAFHLPLLEEIPDEPPTLPDCAIAKRFAADV